ncbi:YopX family protein [Paenibacillus shenyangensis]|uniref:YopX family protein n=1 Tax=Paenibacillus sp. A9 TaxID=1284352 RepID=UPI0003768811|nr:YopX family protein [Paenibacillus sp. A9]
MSREIKFRGKHIETGEWVHGSLIGNDVIVGEIVDWDSEYFATEFWIRVIPETVGQFINIIDKKGKEIYEGDVQIPKSRNSDLKVVCHSDSQAMFQSLPLSFYKNDKRNSGFRVRNDEEVVGNIHDNPEFLEEQA